MTTLSAAYTNIIGARAISFALASDAGAIKGRSVCKSGATTTSTQMPDNVLSATPKIFSDIIETDPNTSAAWTNTNFNAAEFGWEVRS